MNKQDSQTAPLPHPRSPWAWVPTLYFAEGLPNVLVTVVSVTMYMQMGMSDTDIALYTGWLQLPWILKWIWSPFVDLIKTKRWWVLLMQVLIGASLAGVAFTLETPLWFQGTMACFFLMALMSATHDVAADGYYMLALDSHGQSLFVGIRNTFYRIAVIFGQGVLVALAGVLQHVYPNRIAFTWSLIFYGLAGLFILLFLYHSRFMPKVSDDGNRRSSAREVRHGLGQMIVSFVRKMPVKPFIFAMLFLLLYRFPEALLTKMATTFLQRPLEQGGMALSPEEFGFSYGVVGLIGLLSGGIVGGWLAARDGLKRWLWPFVLALTLPDLVYVYMSYELPLREVVLADVEVLGYSFTLTNNLMIIIACLFVEQFGYGLGFTALTLYMLYYCQGAFKTSHYAICTAISYLGLMLPGMFSGWLKDMLGYRHFFLLVMACCAVTFIVTAFIRIDPSFGRKQTK